MSCTHNAGLPSQFRFNVGNNWRRGRSQPEVSDRHPVYAAHCWFNADKSSTTLAQHYSNTGSAVYLAAAPQRKRFIHPMLAQRFRRCSDIETALSDCPVLAGTAHYYAGDTFLLPSPEKPLPR